MSRRKKSPQRRWSWIAVQDDKSLWHVALYIHNTFYPLNGITFREPKNLYKFLHGKITFITKNSARWKESLEALVNQ